MIGQALAKLNWPLPRRSEKHSGPTSAARLATLPSLAIEEDAPTDMCKICGSTAFFLCAPDFNQYCSQTHPPRYNPAGVTVSYYRCVKCQFLFTRFCDGWASSDFTKLIYNEDYAKIDSEYRSERPRRAARDLAWGLEGAEGLRILDYGSGSGAFAAEMRSHGFPDITSYDPYSSPVQLSGTFDVITLFEVIEHTPEPLKVFREISDLLAPGGLAVVSQTLHPDDLTTQRSNWWYLGPRNGHLSTFSTRTFQICADMNSLNYREGSTLYAFARYPVRDELRRPLERIAPFNPPVVLLAPTDRLAVGFHEAERTREINYRWSNQGRVSWPVRELPEGRTAIQIPFAMTHEDASLEQCQIVFNGRPVETVVEERTIVGVLDLPASEFGEIALQMPEPRAPFDLSGQADFRRLGIALLCS